MSRDRKSLGNRGEECAAEFLSRNGYSIVERQYRTRFGEIDIIARDADGALVFAEVKTRHAAADGRYGTAREAVDLRKQRRIAATAQEYLATFPNGADLPACRFDVIEVYVSADERRCRIHHCRDAFIAEGTE